MKKWMEVIPEAEQKTYKRAGFFEKAELGERAALIVVDVTYGFTGSESLTLEQAIQEYPTACGPASWEAMPHIAALIALFRERKLPVVYSRTNPYDTQFAGGAVKSKKRLNMEGMYNEFPPSIAPIEGEWVLEKTKASAFFQTPLQAYLVKERVDTVIVCGVSTSGCVRATSVDSHSNGFTTFVVDDCCFDRSYFSHCTNLFDLNAKYATVLSLSEVTEMFIAPVAQ
ncbi:MULTISPECIES: isochorismatase family protein [unclassified Paenibacillus]|uniref:cysteine hydrolase family protein n=1 Tax=unclassified Paenibacillus TaxID=185978 RepID=UPI00240553FC|nr:MULTISPECIES: isochorismatase family protein [unclassified Paenibacillus]MDF9839795.1 maleamate amidohydrolase [Paenibacillus sp. PastF-2]MDF9846376.1 maleamate amidohydrolase [Paenibacillus sp. PastM-2]MDF9853275.1 maleamate amidohydrolase [Paenibacillus sp. PastF-1]MDH6478221.1 maleamate amidohydrolase [Paenibacillus sp. PastH-2]MDH6506280.1 maleamate amidohydrolase [Paenibacillus sp. PastM-3]